MSPGAGVDVVVVPEGVDVVVFIPPDKKDSGSRVTTMSATTAETNATSVIPRREAFDPSVSRRLLKIDPKNEKKESLLSCISSAQSEAY